MNAPRNLTERLSERQRSATRLDIGQAVSAGAGSGKSTTLVVRYLLAIRAANFDVHRVLAVTFTKKAAAELQRRIRHSVMALARGDAILDGEVGSRTEASRLAWRRVADALPEAWVTTLHGFCQRFLRAGSPDGSLGADFQVLGEEGMGHPASEVAESFLDDIAMNSEDQDHREDVLAWLREESMSQLADRLATLLQLRHRADPWAVSVERRTPEELANLALSLSKSLAQQAMRELNRADARWRSRVLLDAAWRSDAAIRLAGVKDFIEFPFGRAGKVKSLVEQLAQLVTMLLQPVLSAHDADAALAIRQAITRSTAPKANKAMEEGDWKSKFDDLLAASVHTLGAFAPLPDPTKQSIQHDLLLEQALARLYRACRPLLIARLSVANAVDFDGLIDHALAKLEGGSDVPFTFDHILVDEFQDTDPRQWRLVKALKPDLSGVCIVGDEKQAIYRFREGDVETFRRAAHILRYGNAGHVEGSVTLNENYRSSAALVGFANLLSREIFADPSRSELPEPYECAASPMSACRTEHRDFPSRIEVRVLRGSTRGDARRQEMAHVAELIQNEILGRWQVHDGNQLRVAAASDLVVLLEKRTGLAALETALAARHVRFRTISGTGFYERPEVKDCCALLAWLADPDDALATLGLVRSMIVALPDTVLAKVRADRQKQSLWKSLMLAANDMPTSLTEEERVWLADAVRSLKRWRLLSGVLPASSVLDVVLRESTLRLSLGQFDPTGRAEANVDQLVAQIRERESSGDASFATLAREFNAIMDRDAKASQADPPAGEHAITIMTTHGSKGLEFPIVLVVGLGDQRRQRGAGTGPIPWSVTEDRSDLVVDVPRPERGKCTLHGSLVALERAKANAEAARLLYVAVTRAQDHLIMIGSHVESRKPTPNALASILSSVDDRGENVDHEFAMDGTQGATVRVRYLDAADITPVARRNTIDTVHEDFVTPPNASVRDTDVHYRVALRPTSFATAMSCSRKFFLEQGLGAPQTRFHQLPQLAPQSTTTRALSPTARGNAIHAAFEALASGGTPSEHVDWACSSAGIAERAHVEEVRSIVTRAEQGFFRWRVGERMKTALPGEVRSELPMSFEFDGLPVMGTMDLLFAPGDDGPAYVIDFKSDSVRDLSEARESMDRKGYRSQVALYCVAVERILRRPVEGYLFLTALGCELAVVGAPELNQAKTALGALAKAAKNGYPKTTDAAVCTSCDHLAHGRCAGVEG